MVHLVYCDDKSKEILKIIDGTQKMLIRADSGRKIPHSRVFEDEVLYFIEKGTNLITVRALVKEVFNFTDLDKEASIKVLEENKEKLALNSRQLKPYRKEFISLIEIKNPYKIDAMTMDYRNSMADWIILEKIEDAVAGTSIRYNYDIIKKR